MFVSKIVVAPLTLLHLELNWLMDDLYDLDPSFKTNCAMDGQKGLIFIVLTYYCLISFCFEFSSNFNVETCLCDPTTHPPEICNG